MSRLRHGMRQTVLVGASVLREASAGVLDAVAELAAPQIRSASLERELELARQQGRWLSDDERADLLLREQGRAKRRRTLHEITITENADNHSVCILQRKRRTNRQTRPCCKAATRAGSPFSLGVFGSVNFAA